MSVDTKPMGPDDSGTLRSQHEAASGALGQLDFEGQKLRARLRSRMFGVESTPVRIGRFTVLETIGSGGMGVVYAVYDSELDRKVAVKLLHDKSEGRLADSGRLLREAQALAKLSHPNVVQIYEAGTFSGQVYLAMEYVAGPTMRQWQTGGERTWSEVLSKYIEAGRGLAAAHRVGIVHRDFKPANLLMGLDGRVRVVDFGLARSAVAGVVEPMTEGSSASGRIAALDENLTRTGEVLGTPAYMAPEQIDKHRADARSDQFSYCVALYEGLFGRRPHGKKKAAEVLVAISEGEIEEPPKGTGVPRRVVRAILRGLSTDPADRFPRMEELLAQLERQSGRRQRQWVIAAIAGGATVAGVAQFAATPAPCQDIGRQMDAVWDESRKLRIAEAFERTGAPFAANAWQTSSEAIDGYAQRWRAMKTVNCEATHVGGDQTQELHDLRASCLDRRRERLAAMVDLFEDADLELVRNAATAAASLESLEACEDTEMLRLGMKPPSASAASGVAAVREQVAVAASHFSAGHYESALQTAVDAVGQARQLEYPPVLAEALYEFGRAKSRLGKFDEAVTSLLEAVDVAEAGRHDELAANIWIFLTALRGYRLSEPSMGFADGRRAEAAIKRIDGDELRRAELTFALALVHEQSGNYREAEQAAREVLAVRRRRLGPEHPLTGEALGRTADVLYVAGSGQDSSSLLERAVTFQRQAIEVLEVSLGAEHPRVAFRRVSLGLTLAKLGRYKEARSEYKRAEAVYAATFGLDGDGAVVMHTAMAELELKTGRAKDGLEHAQRCYEIRKRQHGAGHPALAVSLGLLGQLQSEVGDLEGAIDSYEKFIAIKRSLPDPSIQDRLALSVTSINVAGSLREKGRSAEALPYLTSAIEVLTKLDPDGSKYPLFTGQALVDLGMTYRNLDRPRDAVDVLERALAFAEGAELVEQVQDAKSELARAIALKRSPRRSSVRAGDHAAAMQRVGKKEGRSIP